MTLDLKALPWWAQLLLTLAAVFGLGYLPAGDWKAGVTGVLALIVGLHQSAPLEQRREQIYLDAVNKRIEEYDKVREAREAARTAAREKSGPA